MKKTYISPGSTLHTMETATVICGSKLENVDNPEVTVTEVDGGYVGTFSSRRQNNVWDSWENEEDVNDDY